MNAKYYIILTGFILFISFPIINSVTSILPDVSSSENRKLKSFPKLDKYRIATINKTLEDYFTDHISIRNRMIRLYNQLNIFVFRSSPVSIKAIVGQNGWYFMSGQEIRTYTGTELFTEEELAEFKNELFRRKKIIEENGAQFLFAIAPNKSNIYPEFMPQHIVKANDEGYGKQLLHYLQKNNFPVIDLYTPLVNAKAERELYFKTDNHWNNYGAFVASNVILKQFEKIDPNVKALDLSEYKIKTVSEKPGNIAKMFSIENEITETNYIPTREKGFVSRQIKTNKYKATEGFAYKNEYEFTSEINNDSLPVVLFIRDSFGEKPFPYIAEQCKKCVCIFDGWQYGLNLEIIKAEKPNIVLLMVIESNLKDVMKNQRLENSH